MRSIGESNTRCSAMVSSTTPRLGPRWPLVLDTTSMRTSRISAASSGSCSGLSFFRSWGPLIDSRRANCLLPRTTARRFPRSLFGPAQLVVPVLRAGIGMLDGMARLLPMADVGFVGLVRDEESLIASAYADRLPSDLTGRDTFVLDPMLATGGTLQTVIGMLAQRGA